MKEPLVANAMDLEMFGAIILCLELSIFVSKGFWNGATNILILDNEAILDSE